MVRIWISARMGVFPSAKNTGISTISVVAAVAVALGILDIILYAQHGDIVLVGQQFCHDIDIVDKGTDHTYTGHIVELLLNVLFGKVVSQALKLVVDAQGSLDAAFDGRNRVPVVLDGKFVVEDFQFCTDLPDRTPISHHQGVKVVGILMNFSGELISSLS